MESFPAPAAFHFTVQYGLTACGIVNGSYQVSQDVLDSARQILDLAQPQQILTDSKSASILAEPVIPQTAMTADQRATLELRPLPVADVEVPAPAFVAPLLVKIATNAKPKMLAEVAEAPPIAMTPRSTRHRPSASEKKQRRR
jgi:hypothetical protein